MRRPPVRPPDRRAPPRTGRDRRGCARRRARRGPGPSGTRPDDEPVRARDEALGRSRRGRRAHLQHDFRPVGIRPRGREQRLPRGEGQAGTTDVGGGLCEHRPAETLGQEGRSAGRGRGTSRDDHTATPGAGRRNAVHLLRGRGRRVRTRMRGTTLRLAAWDRLAFGDQRLVERTVHVDRAGRGALRCAERREPRPSPFLGMLQHGRHRRLEESARIAAEEFHLVDGLVRPGPTERWRAVGGEQDERDPRLRRLHDRGEQLGDRGPARADHRHGPAERRSETHREEAARALVEVDVQLDVGVAGDRERERRGSRAR